jgi:hypothetical protein
VDFLFAGENPYTIEQSDDSGIRIPLIHQRGARMAAQFPKKPPIVLCLLLGLAVSMLPAPGNRYARAEEKPNTVRLVVDYGDGAQKVFPALPWQEGMTVLDAMEKAKAPAHGITFQHTGKGETAFLTQIDDLKNEGGGKSKKNWQYLVNDAYADKSFGIRKLEKGDVILWKFTVFEGK